MQHPVRQHDTRIPIRRVAFGALVALFCVCTPAMAEMAEGSYIGDGAGSRTISGLAFQPAVVIVKGQGAVPAVIRASYMTVGSSKSLVDAAGMIADGIIDSEELATQQASVGYLKLIAQKGGAEGAEVEKGGGSGEGKVGERGEGGGGVVVRVGAG